MGSLPNLHELGNAKDAPRSDRGDRPRTLLARVPTAPAQHQRVFKSKSNGHTANMHVGADDFTLDQQQNIVSGYSPVSTRCTRTIRRRDSLNSSIGATSVRRLISTIGSHRKVTCMRTNSSMSDRRRATHALLAFCVAHAVGSAALLPHLTLQTVKPWGTWFAALIFGCAAPASLLAGVMRKGQPKVPLLAFPVGLIACHVASLVRVPVVTVPVYAALGIILGLSDVARPIALLKIASHLSPPMPHHHHEDEEEARVARRACAIRRSARALQAAQDFGLILGSALAALIISYTGTNVIHLPLNYFSNYTTEAINVTNCNETSAKNYSFWCGQEGKSSIEASLSPLEEWPNSMFTTDESSDRICGARACPISNNFGKSSDWQKLQYDDPLAIVFIVLSILSLIAVVAAIAFYPRGPSDPPERPAPPGYRILIDSFKDFRLQMAAPLACFIGMEQAFMFADFGKTYVVCTLGVERLNLVFLAMGLLQSVAACTLSMVLRSVRRRRYLVVAVGCSFHACLLLVQRLWKPSGDDAALFYVISAAWGVCNAVWEMLTFTLVTGAFADTPTSAGAAFANLFFFRHTGLAVAFVAHAFLCTSVRLYTLSVAMLLAALPYAVLELRLENMRKLRSISRL